jgi:hypothetical protein
MSAGGPAYKQMAPLGGSGDAWPGSGLWRRVGRTMFRTKSVEEALADRDDDGKSLKKCLNLYELVLFGYPAPISTSSFIIILTFIITWHPSYFAFYFLFIRILTRAGTWYLGSGG